MKRILVVMESNNLLHPLIDAMNEEYDFTFCSNAEDALPLPQQGYDCLILDLFLPGMDGISLLQNTHHILPPIILVLTRFISPAILRTLESLGVGYVIRIPCPLSYIAAQLISLLA